MCIWVCHLYYSCFFAESEPTYGALIDLFELVGREHSSDEHVLCALFKDKYSHIEIGRPRRFYETVERICAPLKTSIKPPLTGTELEDYRRRVWRPRIRNPAKGSFALYLIQP